MRNRALVMLGLALVLGVLSVFLVQDWLQRQVQPAAPTGPALALKQIVVARTALAFGNRLGREHVQLIEWPAGSVPPGAFHSIEEVLGEKDDRVVLRPIEPNEPILASKVSGLGGRATLSTIIADEMRAVTIRVNDVLGVAGFILPGDRVDVMLTRELSRGDPITDVLLQNVKVLGIDQEASENKEQPRVARAVTLEVDSPQAQKLTLASRVGTLSLALRNHANAESEIAKTITVRDLKVGGVPEPAKSAPVRRRAAPPVDPLASVSIVRGTNASNYKVHREAGQLASGAPVRLIQPAPIQPD